jgi:hypothetical protein
MTRDPESPEAWFHRLATDHVAAQIVFALNQTGVWLHLAEHGPASPAELAGALGLAPAALDCLLDYTLHVQPLLVRDERGSYALSEFGRSVLRRYERVDDGRRAVNLFDVRIGAYGPVWRALESLLRGTARYGIDVVRDGRFAEDAVYKIGPRFVPALAAALEAAGCATVVELGVNSGLLERLTAACNGIELIGVDRSPAALDRAADGVRRATGRARWIRADLFSSPDWARDLPTGASLAVFSLHFHEFLAQADDAIPRLLAALRPGRAGARILVLEQPRLPASARGDLGETLWLYAQSNVLIHHLIGNGRILSLDAWHDLFTQAGCRHLATTPTGYLGYQLLQFEL